VACVAVRADGEVSVARRIVCISGTVTHPAGIHNRGTD
jgi:hypothetical protein